MAALSFHFISNGGVLQRVDGRVKLLAVLMLSVSAFYADPLGMSILTVLLGASAILSAIPPAVLVREMRLFALIGAVVFLGVALTTPGRSVAALPLVTVEGLEAGALVAWRLVLLIMLGSVLTASTRVDDLRRSVERLLAPVPLVPESKVAFFMSMTVAILPLIYDAASEVRDAQRSRCSDLRRNPVRKIRNLSLPLLVRVFRKADEIGDAMESRGFDPGSSHRGTSRRRPALADYLTALCTAMVCAAVFILRS